VNPRQLAGSLIGGPVSCARISALMSGAALDLPSADNVEASWDRRNDQEDTGAGP